MKLLGQCLQDGTVLGMKVNPPIGLGEANGQDVCDMLVEAQDFRTRWAGDLPGGFLTWVARLKQLDPELQSVDIILQSYPPLESLTEAYGQPQDGGSESYTGLMGNPAMALSWHSWGGVALGVDSSGAGAVVRADCSAVRPASG